MENELPYFNDVSTCRQSLLQSLDTAQQNALKAKLGRFEKITDATTALDLVKSISFDEEGYASIMLSELFSQNDERLPERWRTNLNKQRTILRMASVRDEADIQCELIDSHSESSTTILKLTEKLNRIHNFRSLLELRGNPIQEGPQPLR